MERKMTNNLHHRHHPHPNIQQLLCVLLPILILALNLTAYPLSDTVTGREVFVKAREGVEEAKEAKEAETAAGGGVLKRPTKSDSFENQQIVRTINLRQHILRVSLTFDVAPKQSSAGTKELYKVLFPFPLASQDHLAHTACQLNGETVVPMTQHPQQQQHQHQHPQQYQQHPYAVFTIPGTENLKENFSVKIQFTFSQVFQPFPAELRQQNKQYMVYGMNDTSLVLTPYRTLSERTSIYFPTTNIETKPDSILNGKSTSLSGKTMTIGPIENPDLHYEYAPFLYLHFENNRPFFLMKHVHREVEVSQWGNVAIEEHFDMHHVGAKLVGGFSRLDYTTSRYDEDGPSFRMLKASLPAEATDVYVRDVIGNISTSNLRHEADSSVLEFYPRFPLFGGWHTAWYQGYNIPSRSLVTSKQHEHKLKVNLAFAYPNAVADEMTLKVVIPAGATNLRFTSPIPVSRSYTNERYTFLDVPFLPGRTVLVLEFENVVTPEHNKDLVVEYSIPKSNIIAKPVVISSFFFAIYLFVMLASLALNNIGKSQHTASGSSDKSKVA